MNALQIPAALADIGAELQRASVTPAELCAKSYALGAKAAVLECARVLQMCSDHMPAFNLLNHAEALVAAAVAKCELV